MLLLSSDATVRQVKSIAWIITNILRTKQNIKPHASFEQSQYCELISFFKLQPQLVLNNNNTVLCRII